MEGAGRDQLETVTVVYTCSGSWERRKVQPRCLRLPSMMVSYLIEVTQLPEEYKKLLVELDLLGGDRKSTRLNSSHL